MSTRFKIMIVLAVFIVTAAFSVTPSVAEDNFAGGPVTNIIWTAWGDDNQNSICFAVDGKWLRFNVSSTQLGNAIVAGLLSSLHTGNHVTVEHFDTPSYRCGMAPTDAYNAVGFDFQN